MAEYVPHFGGKGLLAQIGDGAEMIGEAYWGNLPSGTQINTSHAARDAQSRFLKAGSSYLPLVPPIPDEMIQKAIMGVGVGSDGTEMSQAQYHEETEKMRDQLRKAFDAESEEIRKALTAGSSNLMHVIADQDVTYLYKRPYPFQALIPVEANKGKQANFDIIGPYEFGGAMFGIEDTQFNESDITTHNRSQFIKYLYVVGRVTQAAQLAGLSQVPSRDVLAIRVDAAQDAMRALRERALLGVTTDITNTTNAYRASSTIGSQTTIEYNGVYQLVHELGTTVQNWVASTGNSYDQIMVDLDTSYRAMVKYAMDPNLAVCDYRTFGIIRRGLMEYFRTEPVKEFTQGVAKINLVFPSSMGLPLVPHPFLPMGASLGTIFLLDTRLLARRSLWQDMYTELAKINLSQKFVISAAETLVDKSDTDGASSLHGGVFAIT
jgi:hypothetical protein